METQNQEQNQNPKSEDTKAPEKPVANDKGSVDSNSTTPIVEKALDAARRLERANDATAKNLDRQEELMAKQALGGKTQSGATITVNKTQDDLDEEAAKKFLQEE